MEVAGLSAGAYVGSGGAVPNEAIFHDGNGDVSGPKSVSAKTIGFSKILEVDLVMENLLQYLSLKDLKSLTLASKDALIAVRKSKVFSERVVFKICESSLRYRVLDNCFHSWKRVEIADIGGTENIPADSTIPQSLDSVKSLTVDLSSMHNMESSKRRNIVHFILKILDCSKETLEDLTLEFSYSGLDGIESIMFTNLKKLKLSKREIDDSIVETLLENCPPLEKLTVDVFDPSNLCAALQGRMSKLRALDINVKSDWRKTSTPPRAIDWSKVADSKMLEVVNISLFWGDYMASNQDIEELLVNIPAKPVAKIVVKASCGQDVLFSRKVREYIVRFNHLTELSLYNLRRFDNRNLQSVIENCPKLKFLTLDVLHKLTDFGFSGVKYISTGERFRFAFEKRGVSLANLRDLVRLSIRHCGYMYLTNLLGAIEFEFLTTFEFHGGVHREAQQTPREVLLQILERNPSLKEVDLSISYGTKCPTEVDFSLKYEVRRLYPQIQQLRFKYPPDYYNFPNEDELDDEGN